MKHGLTAEQIEALSHIGALLSTIYGDLIDGGIPEEFARELVSDMRYSIVENHILDDTAMETDDTPSNP